MTLARCSQTPKWNELVFGVRAITEDVYFVLDGGPRIRALKGRPRLRWGVGLGKISAVVAPRSAISAVTYSSCCRCMHGVRDLKRQIKNGNV